MNRLGRTTEHNLGIMSKRSHIPLVLGSVRPILEVGAELLQARVSGFRDKLNFGRLIEGQPDYGRLAR